MNPQRCRAIAQLLACHRYTASEGRPSGEYARCNDRVLTSAIPSPSGVEMTFEGLAEPVFIMGDWIVVNDDGTVQFGGWSLSFALILRLTPDPAAHVAASQEAQRINAQYSRV